MKTLGQCCEGRAEADSSSDLRGFCLRRDYNLGPSCAARLPGECIWAGHRTSWVKAGTQNKRLIAALEALEALHGRNLIG